MIYKATIKPKSSYITELTSTTIFGALCWSIKEIEDFGEKALMDRVFRDADGLVVSNAYESGFVSAPLFKGRKLLMNINTGDIKEVEVEQIRVRHCIINRNNNKSNNWDSIENVTDKNLDIYISSNTFTLPEIEKILKVALKNGIGARRSTGKGQFELISLVEIDDILSKELRDKQTNNLGYMVLSDYIPSERDATLGNYSARILRGKTIYGKEKKPLYIINSGSSFKGNLQSDVSTLGKMVYDENTQTYTNGRAIAIKISLE